MGEPYWSDETCALYLGDCREILPALGVTADCIIADPPYGETSLAWDCWPEGWLDVAAEVARSLWCFGSLRMYLEHGDEFKAAGWKFSQDIIWEKQQGTGWSTDRFMRAHEQPTHWYRGTWSGITHETPRVSVAGPSKTWRRERAEDADRVRHRGGIGGRNGYTDDGTRLMQSVIRIRNLRQAGAIHRTQKPTGLLEPMITYACPVAGLVVDPFAGSGSSLMVARMTGRRAIGIELHEPHAEQAARWLSQMTLAAS